MRTVFKNLFRATIIFCALLFLPQAAHAAVLQSVYQDCSSTFHVCGGSLTCVAKSNVNQINIGSQSAICFPEPTYSTCGVKNDGTQAKGDCASLNGLSCATISSIINTGKFTDSCVDTAALPSPSGASADCADSSDCNVGQQCVRVSLPNASGTNTTYGVQRCISLLDLPSKIVDYTGSCFATKTCDAGSVCVQHITDKTADNPFVCQKITDVGASGDCTDKSTIGHDCTVNEVSGMCLAVYQGTAKPQIKCVQLSTLIGGANSPSSQVCNNDNDCKSVTGFPYCVSNPATGKNQCFSQQQIYTAMSSPTDAKCVDGSASPTCTCTAAKTTGCAGNGTSSICSAYTGGGGGLICIHNEALGAGTTKAGFNVPTDDGTRKAPVIEVQIPDLVFPDKLVGTATKGGTNFYVPYLSIYVNAVYKYGIGLGVLFAIIMIMFAGFTYMTAFGNAKAIHTAQDRAKNAATGLVILFSVYTIISVVNPQMTTLKSIQIFAPATEPFSIDNLTYGDEDHTDQGTDADITPGPTAYDDLFKKYAACSGVNWQLMKAVAQHESGMKPGVHNPHSSAVGLFQAMAGKDNKTCKNVLKPVGLDTQCDSPGLTDPELNTAYATQLFKAEAGSINSKCSSASTKDKVFLMYYGHSSGPGAMSAGISQWGCEPYSGSSWPDGAATWPDGSKYGLSGRKVYNGASKSYVSKIVDRVVNLGVSDFSGPKDSTICPLH